MSEKDLLLLLFLFVVRSGGGGGGSGGRCVLVHGQWLVVSVTMVAKELRSSRVVDNECHKIRCSRLLLLTEDCKGTRIWIPSEGLLY